MMIFSHPHFLLLMACIFGFLVTWGVGANDLANVLSTSVGSRSLSMRQLIIISILFEFAGTYLGAIQVSDTIRHGIINTDLLLNTPNILVYGMLSALLAGMTWMTIASIFGLPVSITHTIVGAIVGFGVIVLGVHAIQWTPVKLIALSWLTSPAIAGVFSYLLFISIQRSILGKSEPFLAAKRKAPIYLFLIGAAMAAASVNRGLIHLGFSLSKMDQVFIAIGLGLLIACIGSLMIRKITLSPNISRHQYFIQVEKIFSVLMLFTAASMVFAHGSNDVAIAIGPVAAIIAILQTAGHLGAEGAQKIPLWLLGMGAGGVVLGFLTYGRNVAKTVGQNITSLTPSRAFAATLSAAFTVVVATGTGIPVSATQTLVGAVLGVGLARGIGALNLVVIRNILMSWVITIPVGATFAIFYYKLFLFLGK